MAFNIGDNVSRIPRTAVGSMYIWRVNPKHVKEPRVPVHKSRVLISGVTGQIPLLLRLAVKLNERRCVVDFSLG